jgi:trimeric autotransporter adhesin
VSPTITATADNQFSVRAAGGVRFFTNSTHTSGVQLAPGASGWTILSDVSSKHLFRDLDGEAVLAKLAGMPIREWSYKAQDAAIRHVGPTAQDFHAAFGLGEDPLGISTIDADGIALRAIQPLEARMRREKEAMALENAVLRAELTALRKAMAALLGAEP